MDDFLLARLIAEDAHLPFYKIDPLKLDVQMIESRISRPFARKNKMVPVAIRDGKLLVAMVNPFDRMAIDSYGPMAKQDMEIVVSAESDVMGVINEQYGFRASVTKAERDLSKGAIDLGNLEQYIKLKSGSEIESSDAHIVNAVDFLLQHAYESRASDIHIEPKRENATIRFRIDGVLHEIQRVPKLVNLAITSRLKTMCRMDIAERRRPQDGRIKTEHNGQEVELRVSTLPTAFGEKVVMRIFDPEVMIRELAGLGFYEDELEEPSPTGSSARTASSWSPAPPDRARPSRSIQRSRAWPRLRSTSPPSKIRSRWCTTSSIRRPCRTRSGSRSPRHCARFCGRIRTSSWSARSAIRRRRKMQYRPR
jgi:general secretion pathway protein E